MRKLLTGLRHFQSQVFQSHQELFERLAGGQSPDALFITCSDSRIDPCLITQTSPGDLFILRNAGNIVPPYGATNGGEAATIEFAVGALGVKDIIVCGHSFCGAINGLLNPEKVNSLPTVANWLKLAQATKLIIEQNYSDANLNKEQLLNVAIQENVLVQLENLRSHPTVAAKFAKGELNLHAWTYKIESGEVFSYNAQEGQFLPIREATYKAGETRSRRAMETTI